ncbi:MULTISPECIES: NirD/YgiW/YdeI family stress tolerance protein [Acinetobacter]|uniref:NirD/YgiW/YdeI family stress tolerance protein n=1 Tax=Acinetobacter tandoii TaxID=202954 RepID=A0A5N4WQ84_9GAMM|nr:MULTISPECIES: NirD/YgiW/YdeI family stress tolerance protein [Acinetobacter]AUX84741.1 hypothetical protein C3F34_00765 [Acinetobacter sp. ACNIH2]KAB1857913.1 NirD/YgiW/YdeI family stress tolerance protein [Acinetobacter tandoii]
MNVISKIALVTAFVSTASGFAFANTAVVNQQAIAPTQITVKQALTLKDDTPVKLKGYVVKALGDEKYQFQDHTGSITVDIDDELWRGQPVSAKTPVTLTGEVDIDYLPTKRVEIDVDTLTF